MPKSNTLLPFAPMRVSQKVPAHRVLLVERLHGPPVTHSDGSVPDCDLDVLRDAVAGYVPRPDDEEVAPVLQSRRVPVRLLEEPEPVLARARDLAVEGELAGWFCVVPGA